MQTVTQFNPLEIIKSVSSFYEIGWDHLLWFVGFGGAIIGVIVPLLVQLYQRRFFRIEEQDIKQGLVGHVDTIKQDIEKRFDQKFANESQRMDTEFSELRKKVAKELSSMKGGLFFIQAADAFNKEEYSAALFSYMNAASLLLHGDDQSNLQKVLSRIMECLPKVSNNDLQLLEPRDIGETLIKDLKEQNKSGIYQNYLYSLTRLLEEAKNRNDKGYPEGYSVPTGTNLPRP